jgi:hypothetical protein
LLDDYKQLFRATTRFDAHLLRPAARLLGKYETTMCHATICTALRPKRAFIVLMSGNSYAREIPAALRTEKLYRDHIGVVLRALKLAVVRRKPNRL